MYTLTRVISPRQLITEQVPALGAALVVADLFYKFHSFALECVAFLATWYAFDRLIWLVREKTIGSR